MSERNRHGLSRYIPMPICLELRRRSGFGCVICGSAFITYEHIDPEFADATAHDPTHMAVLCGTCQLRKVKGLLSKEAVRKASENPKCLQDGFSRGVFDVGVKIPDIEVGNVLFIGGTSVLRVEEEELLGFKEPEEGGAPFLLNAKFFDKDQKCVFWIDRNEFYGNSENWDMVITGNRITIRNAPENLSLVLQHFPNQRLCVRVLNMTFGNYNFTANQSGIKFTCDDKNVLQMSEGTIEGKIAFDIKGEKLLVNGVTIKGSKELIIG